MVGGDRKITPIKENPKLLMFAHISLLEFFQNILILRWTGASSGMFHVPFDSLIQGRIFR